MATLHVNEQPDEHRPRELSTVQSSSGSEPKSPLNEPQDDQPNSIHEMQNLQANGREESNLVQTTGSSTSAIAGQEVPKEWHEFLAPIICIVMGLGALVFGACIIVSRNKEQSKYTTQITEATRVISTLWPLLFAAALGDAVKTIARWRAEKGAKLIHVEHLMGSQTVISSVISTGLLGPFWHWQALLLILIWTFSPVGSQALLRALDLRENFLHRTHTTPMRTVNPNFFADLIQANGSSTPWPPFMEFVNPYVGSSLTSLEAGFQNMNGTLPDFQRKVDALGASLQNYGSDLWGNVRIPKIELLPGYDSKNPYKWVDVPYRDGVVEYASLIGIPIADLPQDIIGNFSWEMGANYHRLSCDPWEVFENSTRRANFTRDVPFLRDNYAKMYYYYNATLPPTNVSSRGWSDVIKDIFDDERHFIIDTEKLNFDTDSWKGPNGTASGIQNARHPADFPWKNNSFEFPQRAMFVGIKGFTSDYALTKCAVSMRYVDINVTYERTTRGKSPMVVNRVRRQRNPLTSTNIHAFQWPAAAWQLSDTFPILLQPNDGTILSIPTSLRYIMDPVNFTTELYIYQAAGMNFSTFLARNLTIQRFEDRFSLVFNTFWKAFAYTYALTDLDVMYKQGFNDRSDANYTIIQRPIQYISPLPATYRLNTPWIIVYMLSSFVLLVASVTSLALKISVRGPDLLGFVGSLLRASQHFSNDTPVVSSTIGGFKATKLLKDKNIQVGVRQDEEPGKIALVEKNGSHPVRKGERYL